MGVLRGPSKNMAKPLFLRGVQKGVKIGVFRGGPKSSKNVKIFQNVFAVCTHISHTICRSIDDYTHTIKIYE